MQTTLLPTVTASAMGPTEVGIVLTVFEITKVPANKVAACAAMAVVVVTVQVATLHAIARPAGCVGAVVKVRAVAPMHVNVTVPAKPVENVAAPDIAGVEVVTTPLPVPVLHAQFPTVM